MIYTPMLYIMTYAILGSAKDFRENQSAIFLCLLFYALTHSFFIAFKSQSPGMRYAQFKLVKNNRKKVGFFLALWRFVLWVLSMGLLIGFVTPFILSFFCMTNSAALILKSSRRKHEKFSNLKRGWHFSRKWD